MVESRGRLRFLLAALGAASCLVGPAPALGQKLAPQRDFYVTDNVVETIEVVGDSVYVGGHFTHVGAYTGPVAPISISSGETIPGFPEANDFVFALAPDGTGGWLVGGDFTEIGGVPRNHVARILPDLSVDPDWNPDADYRVRGFAIHDSVVYMHGYFSMIGGEGRDRLAAVSMATGELTPWDPDPNGVVEDFFLDGDTLYVVGSFTTIGGEPRHMAAFDLTTGALTDFDPLITNDVEAVVAKDGVVYVGGRFSTAGGEMRNRLAAFDATTSAVLPWDPSVGGSAVLDLALRDSTLIAGGAFSSIGGAIRNSVAEISLASGAPLATFEGTTGLVTTLLVRGDSLYVGGDFTELESEDRRYLGGYDLNTGEVLDTPSPLDVVNALAITGDTMFVGGEFGAVSGIIRNRFAAFRASTLELLPWAPDFQNIVWQIESSPGADTLYVSGRFNTVDEVPRENVASFDLATGGLTSLQVTCSGDVYAISVTDSLVYLGGTYALVNGLGREDLACIDRVTGALTPWNPGSGGIVNTIKAWNDTVYVGGNFYTVGDSSRTNVAAVNGTTGEVLGWGSDLALSGPDDVEAFFPLDHPSYPNGAFFMGGDFLNLGIGLRRGVAALHRDTGNALYGWNPALGPSFETEVREFVLADDLLYMAGDFRGVLYNDADGVAAVDVVTGKANPWVVNAHNANAIAVSDSMVFVGGYMREVQGYPFTYLAAFRRDTVPPSAASALVATPGKTDKRIDLSWAASSSEDVQDYLVYRTFSAGADTTGHQIAITAETFYVDIAPAYGEWFYRVYARDDAHNLAPASNEDSAVAPQIVPPMPSVTTSVHQNPALSNHATVVVVSDSLLTQPPVVTIVRPPDPTETPVTMAIIPSAPSAYSGPWVITGSGLHTIQTSIVAVGGNTFDFERDFTATLLRPASGGEARSATGMAALRVPAGLLREEVYVVAEETLRDDALSTVRFGPDIAFDQEVTLEFAYDAAVFDDPSKLFVARLDGAVPTPIPSDVLLEHGVVRANVDRLGEFGLVYDPAYEGDNIMPIRFALHPNQPNPFSGSTTLRFDLPRDGRVFVSIYDVKGRRVAVLLDGFEAAGRHALSWDGRNGSGGRVAAGVYFARVKTDNAARSQKIVRLR